jgi:hypothetical protein
MDRFLYRNTNNAMPHPLYYYKIISLTWINKYRLFLDELP